MRKVNCDLANKIADRVHKKYGVITYSGTLAIESALLSLSLKAGSHVLVAFNVCYSIVNTIKKIGLCPVIVTPKDELLLTDEDIDMVLNKENIDCILLVHQYGLLNAIDKAKYKRKNIKIIEDIAQAWDIENREYKVGENSDIVVTSFGKTKPLSYGIGGGLFFNDPSILHLFDFCDNSSREEEHIIYSYVYPLVEKICYDNLINIANRIVTEQRNAARLYSNILKKQNMKIVEYLDYDYHQSNVWHRYPIWFYDLTKYKKFIELLDGYAVEYQLSHEIPLEDLKMCSDCFKIKNSYQDKYFILLRTRNIDIEKQQKCLEEILLKMK